VVNLEKDIPQLIAGYVCDWRVGVAILADILVLGSGFTVDNQGRESIYALLERFP
jgi:hypothetical protein